MTGKYLWCVVALCISLPFGCDAPTRPSEVITGSQMLVNRSAAPKHVAPLQSRVRRFAGGCTATSRTTAPSAELVIFPHRTHGVIGLTVELSEEQDFLASMTIGSDTISCSVTVPGLIQLRAPLSVVQSDVRLHLRTAVPVRVRVLPDSSITAIDRLVPVAPTVTQLSW